MALERTGMDLKFHPFSWDSVLQDAKTVPAKTRPEGKKRPARQKSRWITSSQFKSLDMLRAMRGYFPLYLYIWVTMRLCR